MLKTPFQNLTDATPQPSQPDANRNMMANFIELSSLDFQNGPILINRPGVYVLKMSVQNIDWSDQQSFHDHTEAIFVRSNNVEINLNGHSLSFSETMLALNPEIAIIRADPKLSRRYLKITNGTLGRAAYGAFVPNTENVRFVNLKVHDFSRAGIVCLGCRMPLYENVDFSSMNNVIKTTPLYECFVRNVFLGNVIQGLFPPSLNLENEESENGIQLHPLQKRLVEFTQLASDVLQEGTQEGSDSYSLFVKDDLSSYDQISAIVMGGTKMRPNCATGQFKDVTIRDFQTKRSEWKGISLNESPVLRDALGYVIPYCGFDFGSEKTVFDKVCAALVSLQLTILSCFNDSFDSIDFKNNHFWNSEVDEVTLIEELDFRGIPLHASPLIQLTKTDAFNSINLTIQNIDFSFSQNKTQWLIYISDAIGVNLEQTIIQGVSCAKDIDVLRLGDNLKKANIKDLQLHSIDSADGTICGIIKSETSKVEDVHVMDYRCSAINSLYNFQPVHCPNREQQPLSFSINPTSTSQNNSDSTSNTNTSNNSTNTGASATTKGITFPIIQRPVNLLGTIKSRQ